MSARPDAHTDSLPDETVRAELGDFFETCLGRPLSAQQSRHSEAVEQSVITQTEIRGMQEVVE